MQIPCNKIIIKRADDIRKFQVGRFLISYITLDTANKIVMVRDLNNIVKLYSYDHVDVEPILPFPQKLINVLNLF